MQNHILKRPERLDLQLGPVVHLVGVAVQELLTQLVVILRLLVVRKHLSRVLSALVKNGLMTPRRRLVQNPEEPEGVLVVVADVLYLCLGEALQVI